jgi:hypothetical protein
LNPEHFWKGSPRFVFGDHVSLSLILDPIIFALIAAAQYRVLLDGLAELRKAMRGKHYLPARRTTA